MCGGQSVGGAGVRSTEHGRPSHRDLDNDLEHSRRQSSTGWRHLQAYAMINHRSVCLNE